MERKAVTEIFAIGLLMANVGSNVYNRGRLLMSAVQFVLLRGALNKQVYYKCLTQLQRLVCMLWSRYIYMYLGNE